MHGGDLAAAALRYGVDPAGLTDFSANISPYGPPPAVSDVLRWAATDPRVLAPYPSPDYASLRAALARHTGVAMSAIVVGHGAAALLDGAVRSAAAPSWIVPVPAFSEYRRVVETAAARFIPFSLSPSFEFDAESFVERLHALPGGGAILNSPHNPSGRAFPRGALRAVAASCARLDRPLIVDEAFIDYAPERSLVPELLEHPRTVVVRSLTKFYALAGVRVGYAIANPRAADAIRAALPSWPVGTLDARIAQAALEDRTYDRLARDQTAAERGRLVRAFGDLGITPFPSAANFLLIELPVARERMDDALTGLARAGVIVRDCRDFEGLEHRSCIRVAVLGPSENQRLIAALRPVLGG